MAEAVAQGVAIGFEQDVEDLEAEMVDRFEFEIDTERALTNWQAEIDANLAAGRTGFDPVEGIRAVSAPALPSLHPEQDIP